MKNVFFNNFQNDPSYQQVCKNTRWQVQANGLGLKFLVNLSELKWIKQSQRREKNSRFNVFVYEGHDSWHTRYIMLICKFTWIFSQFHSNWCRFEWHPNLIHTCVPELRYFYKLHGTSFLSGVLGTATPPWLSTFCCGRLEFGSDSEDRKGVSIPTALDKLDRRILI